MGRRQRVGKCTYEHLLNPLYRWLAAKGKLPNFTAGDVEEYISSNECGLEKPSSKCRLLDATRRWVSEELDHLETPTSQEGFMKYVVTQDRLKRIARVTRPRVPLRANRKALTIEEIRALLTGAKFRDRCVSYLYLYTGVRPSELLEGIKKTEPVDGHWRVTVYSSKTDSERVLFIPSDVKALLDRARKAGWLDLGYEAIRRRVKKYDALVGIHLTPHVFRHTFQTHMRNVLNDTALVAALMGHFSKSEHTLYKTTDIYDSTFESEIQEAMINKHYMNDIPLPVDDSGVFA